MKYRNKFIFYIRNIIGTCHCEKIFDFCGNPEELNNKNNTINVLMCHMCSCVKSLSWISLKARPVVNYAIASIHFCARLFELHSTENPLIEITAGEDLFEQTCLRVPQFWLKLEIWATKHPARVLWNFCGKSSPVWKTRRRQERIN